MKKIIIGIILAGLSAAYGQQKANIAVMELEGKGITQTEASVLTDKLRSELINTDRFSVIERNRMNEILREQGFQNTGCTTQECAVEMGQLIGVERIAAGSVGKIGSMFIISIRLIDVASGKIVKEISEEVEGAIEDVVKAGITRAARKLAGPETGMAVKKAEPPPAEPPKPAKEVPKSRKRLALSMAFQMRFRDFESGEDKALTGFSLDNKGGNWWTSMTGASSLGFYPWPRLGFAFAYLFIMNPIDGANEFYIQETGQEAKNLDYVSANGQVYALVVNGNIELSEKFRLFLAFGNGIGKFKSKFKVPEVNTGTSGKRIRADLHVQDGDRIEDIFNGPENIEANSSSLILFLKAGVEWRPVPGFGMGVFYHFDLTPVVSETELDYTITEFDDSSVVYDKGTIDACIVPHSWANLEIALTAYF